ncbi:hypothetical protein N665_0291s0023 [Sinapis alba]|nr:hypothetical protein N665_0291s0023 [Sinapis alba]
MSRFSSFLIVIALCVELSNGELFPKDSVHFKNSLQPNNILKVHCISDEDDLGDHLLSPGQTYDISFYESIFTTKVNCVLWQGPGFKFYALFRAYEGGGVIVHYGKKNFWDAREDGIYFTHGRIAPKLEYKWLVWPTQ